MTTNEIKSKISDIASIIGIIIGITMFTAYLSSMQNSISNVKNEQAKCVTIEKFEIVIDAINKQTETLSINQHSINSEQNKINNKIVVAIEKNSMELEGLKETNNKFYDYFKGYTQQYFKMKLQNE